MIDFEEAVARVRAAAAPVGTEIVALRQAHGRILAEPVWARIDAPPADVSAMDGYAVADSDLAALPARLEIIGESFAGRGYDGRITTGQCIRIFTGAPVPTGADRVVVQEMVDRDGGTARFERTPGGARHIRPRACDFAEGDRLLAAGRRLDYRAMVAAAGADVDALLVWKAPRFFLLATGDELTDPGSARSRPDAIPESVSFGVAALAEDWGGIETERLRLGDDLPLIERAAREATEQADLVIVTGGASVGEKDFARRMFEPLGLDFLFEKVAIKPGKPVWLGRAGGTLVIGLPGNPTSALVTARLLLAPLVAGMSGRKTDEALHWSPTRLAEPLGETGDRETFVRARSTSAGAVPLSNQDSSAQRAIAEADLLLRRPAGSPAAAADEAVDALML